jgi:5'-nucleotidase
MMVFRLAVTALATLGTLSCTQAPYAPASPVTIKVVAFNDFHGNLQSPGKLAGSLGQPQVSVGGADYLAAYVSERVSHNALHVIVSAGDLIGASPLVSAAYHDEATIEVMRLLGLEISSVGNHEFDAGSGELLRKQIGGCLPPPARSCLEDTAFTGATFKYLAANVVVKASGKTLFPAYEMKSFGGVRIAFVGAVLKDTLSIVSPSGTAGLDFTDEAAAVNALIPQLRSQQVNSIVLLVHQGAIPTVSKVPNGTTLNDCAGILGEPGSTAIADLVSRLEDPVDAVISAHTHTAYICRMKNSVGREIPVTEASAFGRVITDMDITLDPASGRAINVAANNVLVSQPVADAEGSAVHPFLSSPRVAGIRSLIADYLKAVAPVAQQVVGTIAAALPSTAEPSGEELAADLVADSQLAATASPEAGGAVMSFVNASGVRYPGFNLPNVSYPHDVTYQEAFTVRPFGNNLITMALTAQQIKDVLEQQFAGCKGQTADNLLQISQGLHVEWSSSAAPCQKIVNVTLLASAKGAVLDRIVVNGMVPSPSKTYRVSIDSFLSAGKNHFTVFLQGKDMVGGPQDIDALVSYMKATYLSPHKPFDPKDPKLGIPRIAKIMNP